MTPQAALEALDQKAGRVHTRADMQRIYEKSLTTPAAIMEDDLVIVRFFHGEKEADKYAALRAKAIAGPPAAPAPTATTKAPSLRKYFDQYSKGMVEALTPIFKSYQVKIAALERELAELKADHAALDAKALKGGAAWQRGVTYAVNDCVQHDGSLWKCLELHTSGASFSHECFLLQIKHGRDGKDARL
jgi:Carbohydrate-binding module family 5/12